MKTDRVPIQGLFLTLIFASLTSVPFARAEPVSSAAAAATLVPMGVFSAKKVFLSNAGLDGGSIAALDLVAKTKTDIPYAEFAGGMQSWGRYDLVTTPADSEVVFEFRVESVFDSLNGAFAFYTPFLSVAILDTKTHTVLWTVKSPPIEIDKKRFDQSLASAVKSLLDSLKALVSPGSDAEKRN